MPKKRISSQEREELKRRKKVEKQRERDKAQAKSRATGIHNKKCRERYRKKKIQQRKQTREENERVREESKREKNRLKLQRYRESLRQTNVHAFFESPPLTTAPSTTTNSPERQMNQTSMRDFFQ